jgi:hypothetical protein
MFELFLVKYVVSISNFYVSYLLYYILKMIVTYNINMKYYWKLLEFLKDY